MTGSNLLLLHGALGAGDQFAPLWLPLADHYKLHVVDFEGHGRAPGRGRPFRIEHFVQNVVEYLDAHGIGSTSIFGYSMGGYVTCSLAAGHPQRVERVATLGTKFFWDADIAARETALLDPHKIAAKVPHYARALAERHAAAGWETVLKETSGLLWSLAERGGFAPDDLARIEQRVRIIVGDRDSTVSIAECVEVYRALPRGELEVLPATPHPLERISHDRLSRSLIEFFGSE